MYQVSFTEDELIMLAHSLRTSEIDWTDEAKRVGAEGDTENERISTEIAARLLDLRERVMAVYPREAK